MYRLTNLTQNTTTTYKNRDLVYQALERENAKVKHQEAEAVLLVEELDKKNVVIYQEDIYLPFEGIADSLFLKPGTINHQEASAKEAKTSLFKRQTKTTRPPQTLEEKEEVPSLKQETLKTKNSSRPSFFGVSGKSFDGAWSSRKSDTCWLITYTSFPSRNATLSCIQGTF